jgi:hypothetical protein
MGWKSRAGAQLLSLELKYFFPALHIDIECQEKKSVDPRLQLQPLSGRPDLSPFLADLFRKDPL